jgi:hypothetical protein
MWFLPSYGRPQSIERMRKCPGGLPDTILVLINEDDPRHEDYHVIGRAAWFEGARVQWMMVEIPSGARCADAHRLILQRWPNEKFYGLLCDDQWPVTPEWWWSMENAAEDRYVVTPQGEASFPLCRTAVCLGGGLVRAMGSLVPVPVKHNFEDNLWDQIAADFKLLRPMPEHRVEHRHWTKGTAKPDMTYARGSADFERDAEIYDTWMKGPEKAAMYERIAEFLKS